MFTVTTFALAVGLLGGWVYAGCPLPSRSARKPVVGDEAVVAAPVAGASTARP
jgi:hypothetical protein